MAYTIHQQIKNDTGVVFESESIIKLGVQGPINTRFKINGGSDIVIGRTGIYELDLANTGFFIHKLEVVEIPDKNASVYIDYLKMEYVEGGVEE